MSNYKKQPKVRIKETGEVKAVQEVSWDDGEITTIYAEGGIYGSNEAEFIIDDKISDCCGAETVMCIEIKGAYVELCCTSCGEPCEAVEDTKPDPIEPTQDQKIMKIIGHALEEGDADFLDKAAGLLHERAKLERKAEEILSS